MLPVFSPRDGLRASAGARASVRWRTPAPSISIVHDYLNQRGGAERVVLEMARLWPSADIHTSLYRADSTHAGFADRYIHTSWLNRMPVDRRFRALLPLYPLAMRDLGTLDSDIVVSSSSGWAHAVRTRPDSVHVCYCHTPARWLWDGDAYSPAQRRRTVLAPLLAGLRRWDLAVARRPTAYVANSERTRRAIERVYGRVATVIPPPVGIERFTPRRRGDRLLVISRLLPYKRVDLVVAAAKRLGVGLDVVGDGPMLNELRDSAGSSIQFHGRVDDDVLSEMLEACRALVLAGVEDFGIVPVEANAAGKPVVAFAAGGVLETQVEGVTASYFDEQTPEALVSALRRVEELPDDPLALRANARRFDRGSFGRALNREVSRVYAAALEGERELAGTRSEVLRAPQLRAPDVPRRAPAALSQSDEP